jgi:hypothetical protein
LEREKLETGKKKKREKRALACFFFFLTEKTLQQQQQTGSYSKSLSWAGYFTVQGARLLCA